MMNPVEKEESVVVYVDILMDEPYTLQMIQEAFSICNSDIVFNFEEPNENQLVWKEYEHIDFERVYHNKDTRSLLTNAYCIRKGLIRKGYLSMYLKKYTTKTPESCLCKAVPETFNFEISDFDYFEESMREVFELRTYFQQNQGNSLEERHRFILKSSIVDKASEILIFDDEATLEAFFYERFEAYYDDETGDIGNIREWVIQRYVDRPLLVDQRKFHIRTYVVCAGSLDVYVYRHMLALLAANLYSNSDLKDLGTHITNTCIHSDLPHFDSKDSVRLYWGLDLPPADLDNYYVQIKDIVHDVFDALYHEPTVFQPLPGCFEVFGFDFLIDQSGQVSFLEANAFPDFKQTGKDLDFVIRDLFASCINQVIHPFFSKRPVSGVQDLDKCFSLSSK